MSFKGGNVPVTSNGAIHFLTDDQRVHVAQVKLLTGGEGSSVTLCDGEGNTLPAAVANGTLPYDGRVCFMVTLADGVTSDNLLFTYWNEAKTGVSGKVALPDTVGAYAAVVQCPVASTVVLPSASFSGSPTTGFLSYACTSDARFGAMTMGNEGLTLTSFTGTLFMAITDASQATATVSYTVVPN